MLRMELTTTYIFKIRHCLIRALIYLDQLDEAEIIYHEKIEGKRDRYGTSCYDGLIKFLIYIRKWSQADKAETDFEIFERILGEFNPDQPQYRLKWNHPAMDCIKKHLEDKYRIHEYRVTTSNLHFTFLHMHAL